MAKLLFLQKNLFFLENLRNIGSSGKSNEQIDIVDEGNESNDENDPTPTQPKRKKMDNSISISSSDDETELSIDQSVFTVLGLNQ